MVRSLFCRASRSGNAVRHDLLAVLTMALTAAICGAESCVDFADFAADRERLFREFLKLENGVPSHDTFSRIFRLLDPSAFAECFGRFVARLGAVGQGVLTIDGKTLRRSFDRAGTVRNFMRRLGMIGAKEPDHAATQRTSHSRRRA
jgi:hypothetical protein